jgi:hypothetical protein
VLCKTGLPDPQQHGTQIHLSGDKVVERRHAAVLEADHEDLRATVHCAANQKHTTPTEIPAMVQPARDSAATPTAS